MSIEKKRVLYRFVMFGLIGMVMEVFFTAGGAFIGGDWDMHGHSSPWMILDYGLLGLVLMPIARPMIRRQIPLPLRAVVYMLGIFAVEFISGWIFDMCGLTIWDYSHLPLHLMGYITLTYAPFWYGLGLVVEAVYRRVDVCALVLAKGLSAGHIEKLEASRSI